jgi:hypothetical protein
MQHAQSNDESGYASLRSEEVTGGAKIKAQIAVHSRTNAIVRGFSFLKDGNVDLLNV